MNCCTCWHVLNPASLSPNGQVLAFVQYPKGAPMAIWMLPLTGDPQPFIESTFHSVTHPTFSPDGRWLAYRSGRSGRSEINVTPYPGPGPRVQISSDGGSDPVWAPNGRELFFLGPRNGEGILSMWAVDITTEPSFSVGNPRELFSGNYRSTGPIGSYDVGLDGQSFLMVKRGPRVKEPVTYLHLTLNWFEELKRLVPTE